MKVIPSSGSSRCEAPSKRSRSTWFRQSGLSAMNAKLFEERTVFKVVVPQRVQRIRIRPDFNVTPDFGFSRINQSKPNGFPRLRPFPCVRRKVPCAARLVDSPILVGDPSKRPAGMSALGPLPEGLPQSMFHLFEGLI